MKYAPIVVCFIVLYIFFLPLGRSDVVIAGHDAGYHFTRLQLFTAALKDGQFPVRWIEGPVQGLSHPLFQFYPPLFYYLSSFIVLAGIPYVNAIYIALIIAGAIGWVSMYWFVKMILEIAASSKTPPRNDIIKISALISASMFLLTPYRISQFYVRAAYGEFLATSLVPCIFLGILLLMQKTKSSMLKDQPLGMGVLTAGAFAGVLMSHQPTLLMALPFIMGWVVCLWILTQNTRGVMTVALAAVAGLFLSSTFLFPLVLEQQFIRASALASNYFDFRIHFATLSQLFYSAWGYGVSQKGPQDGMSFQVGVLNWIGVVSLIGIYLYAKYFQKKSLPLFFIGISLFFLVLFGGAIFFSLDLSLPVWERMGALSFIQYPWRFLSLGSIATSVLSGCAFFLGIHQIQKNQIGYALGIGVFLVLFNIKYIAPAAFLPRNSFDLHNPELAKYNSSESPFFGIEMGYMPIFTKELSLQNTTEKTAVVSGTATVTEKSIGIVRQSFEVKATEISTIRILTHYFPGWTVKIDEKNVVPAYNNSEGFIEVTVPSGTHTVVATLEKTQIRMVSDYLSFGTALGLVGIAIFSLKRFWSKYSGAVTPALS